MIDIVLSILILVNRNMKNLMKPSGSIYATADILLLTKRGNYLGGAFIYIHSLIITLYKNHTKIVITEKKRS